MTKSQLNRLLKQHKLFLESNGERGNCLDIHIAKLVDVNLEEFDLTGAKLTEVQFLRVKLNRAELTSSMINQCKFTDCKMRNICLHNATIKFSDFETCNFGAHFSTNANIWHSKFDHSYLSYGDFAASNLDDCTFNHSDLEDIDFTNAKLFDIRFSNCELRGINWRNATIPWNSHEVIANILFQNADISPSKRQIAGLILMSRDLCWDGFLRIKNVQKTWALQTLAKFIQPDDNHPKILDKYK